MSPRRPQRSRPAATSSLAPQVEPLAVAGAAAVPETRTPAVTESGSSDLPRYQQMIRKEARLRPDQVDALARLRRRITRARTTRAETITDNTLVRVAVDLLLARADELHGDTEDELRRSVTL